MNEQEGCAILKRRFTEAGLSIQEHYSLAAEGIPIVLDGFDPVRRVGFEYITTAAGDRAELTPEAVAALEARIKTGDLFVLLIDEIDVGGESALLFAATHFLEALKSRGALP